MADGDGIAGSSTVVGTHDLVQAAHEFMEAARTFQGAAETIKSSSRSAASQGGATGFFSGLMGGGTKNGGGFSFSGFKGANGAGAGGSGPSGSGGSGGGQQPPSGGGFMSNWSANGNGGGASFANSMGGAVRAVAGTAFQWGVNGGSSISQMTSNAMMMDTANRFNNWGGPQSRMSQGFLNGSANASDASAAAITLKSGLPVTSGFMMNKMAGSTTSITMNNPMMSAQQGAAVMAGFNSVPTMNLMSAFGMSVQGKSIQEIARMFMQKTGMPMNGISRTTGKPFTANQIQELVGPTSNAYADVMMMVQSGAITQDMASAVLRQIGINLQLGGSQAALGAYNSAASTGNGSAMNSIIPGSGVSGLQRSKNIMATQSNLAQGGVGQSEMNAQLGIAQGMSNLSGVTQTLTSQFQDLSNVIGGIPGVGTGTGTGGDSILGAVLGGKGGSTSSILKGLFGGAGFGGDAGGSGSASVGVAGGSAGGFSEAAVLQAVLSGTSGGTGPALGSVLARSSTSVNGALGGAAAGGGSTGTGGSLYGTDFTGAPSGSVPAAMCLYEVCRALGIPGGYPGAYQAWQAAVSGQGGTTAHVGDSNPPPGALVFWGPGSHGYGHVAISVGGGKVDSPGGPRDKSWAQPFVNGKRQSGSWGTYSIGEITGGKLNYLGWTEGLNGKTTVKKTGGAIPKGSGTIYRALRSAGASDSAAQTLVGIAGAESHYRLGAVGDVGLENSTWGPSFGLFQIRTLKNPGNDNYRNINDLQSLQQQVAAAMAISSGGTNFHPWSTYNSGSYKAFVGNQYDRGSWELGRDQIAKVHKGEMILPADAAESFRQVLKGEKGLGGGGFSLSFGANSINVTIKSSGDSTLDGRVLANSFVKELSSNATLQNLRGGVR